MEIVSNSMSMDSSMTCKLLKKTPQAWTPSILDRQYTHKKIFITTDTEVTECTITSSKCPKWYRTFQHPQLNFFVQHSRYWFSFKIKYLLTFSFSWASLTVLPSFFFLQLCPSFLKYLSTLRSNRKREPPIAIRWKLSNENQCQWEGQHSEL